MRKIESLRQGGRVSGDGHGIATPQTWRMLLMLLWTMRPQKPDSRKNWITNKRQIIRHYYK